MIRLKVLKHKPLCPEDIMDTSKLQLYISFKNAFFVKLPLGIYSTLQVLVNQKIFAIETCDLNMSIVKNSYR